MSIYQDDLVALYHGDWQSLIEGALAAAGEECAVGSLAGWLAQPGRRIHLGHVVFRLDAHVPRASG